jgi:4-oxalmesaconate hydratase
VIIDAHAHLVAPPSLYAYRSLLQVSGGQHGAALAEVKDDELKASADSNVRLMDEVGTDLQLLSPRPFMLINRGRLSDARLWARSNNEIIARTVRFHPTRFRGVAALPQVPGQPIESIFEEIDYCVNELGFVGVLLNPDPGEGLDQTPPLGDPYWYPLYEKLVALDLPAHIHSGGCSGRETYDEHFITEESLAITSVARSDVFERFPSLKLFVSHGGGSIPYQIGRWRSNRQMQLKKDLSDSGFGYRGKSAPGRSESFDATLRRFWFDTVVHNKKSLELLFDVVGPERCLFGTERPGSGSAIDPDTGRPYDDLKPVIESIATLDDRQKRAIFEENARRLFTRLPKPAAVA